MISVEVVSTEVEPPAFLRTGVPRGKAAFAAVLLLVFTNAWAGDSAAGGVMDVAHEDFLLTGRSHLPKAALTGMETDEEFSVPTRNVIDLLALYTPLAKQAYGQAAIEAKVTLGVAYLNEAFNRSGVYARVRVIRCLEATWHNETPQAHDELYWLCNDARVAEVREEVGADLVTLMVRDGFPNGGVAQLPGWFSVFNGNAHLLAHECGHNLGCFHERAHAGLACDPADSSYGYVFTPPGTRFSYGDVMSYKGSQYQQFSNPDRFFQGAPTGVPEGHTDLWGAPDAADNAAKLNGTVSYVAATRWPQATLLMEPHLSEDGSRFTFQIAGFETGLCKVEHTDDLRNWQALQTVQMTEGVELVDLVAGQKRRFYRARSQSGFLPSQVGFVRRVVRHGFSMISNPLETGANSLAEVLPNVPESTQIYRWIEGLQSWDCASFSLGEWDRPSMTLHPGEGAVIRNPGAPFTVAFIGEVNAAMHNRVPTQLSVRSSSVPRAGRLTSELGYEPFGPGGQIFRMIDGRYEGWVWDGQSWWPDEPVLEVGEAVWCRNPVNAVTWIQPPGRD